MVRSEIISLRSERDKFNSEANIAREKLESFMKEFERQVIFFAGIFFPIMCFDIGVSRGVVSVRFLLLLIFPFFT